MKRTLLALLAAAATLAVSLVAGGPPRFDSGRAYDDLRQIVALGPRPAGSPALDATRRYIRRQVEAAGVKVADQSFEETTPVGRVRFTNLVATIPGARPDRLVFAGHIDTKLFRDFRFVGANDAGSSTAFLIELSRVLSQRKNPLTMEILFLDGEEAFHPTEWQGTDHTYGSRYYVEAARKSGTLKSLKALVLVDMVGNRDIVLKREGYSTPWLVDAIWGAARKLGLRNHFVEQTTYIEDDHVPFVNAGVPSVDLIDFDGFQRWWHTADDTLDKVSARSLQVVADALLAALPAIETRVLNGRGSAPARPVRTPGTQERR